jgi:tetratricopeptide (TPR) repeat protein
MNEKYLNLAFRMKVYSHFLIKIFFLLPFALFANGQDVIEDLNKSLSESFDNKDYNKAESIALSIIEDSKYKDTSVLKINANTILAIIYKDRGFYSSAIDKNLLVVQSTEKRKDYERLSAAYNNIGVLYKLQRNYTSAISYFTKSLKIEQKFNKPLSKSIRYYNLGECYKEVDSFDLALSFFSNSLIIEKKHKNFEGVLYTNLGLIDVYLNINQISDAKRLLDRIQIEISKDNEEIYFLYQKSLGYYLFKVKDFESSIECLDGLELYLLSTKNERFLIDVYRLQIQVYEKTKDWERLSSKYKQFLDKITDGHSIQVQNRLNEVMHQNDLNKKELELRLIEKDRDYNANLYRYSSKVAIFLLLLLIFIVGFVIYGLNKK